MELIPNLDKEPEDQVELEAEATSLDFLRQVYRNASLPLSTRMRAAQVAIQFEHPKLGVSVNVPWSDEWATRLERAIERSSQVLSNPPLIEPMPKTMAEVAPIVTVPDRRFRRA